MTDITKGETLEVDYTRLNVGDSDANQTVTLEIDSTQEDSESVTVASETRETGTLTWDTSGASTGDKTVKVSSDDDSDSTTVTVVKPADFQINITSTNAPVTEGSALDVNYTVTNTGNSDAGQQITLVVGLNVRATEFQQVAAGDTVSSTLSWNTSDGDAGDYTAEVSSDDDSDTASVAVNDPVSSGVNTPHVWATTPSSFSNTCWHVAFKGNTVFAAGAGGSGPIAGLDASNGTVKWSFSANRVFNIINRGGTVYADTYNGSNRELLELQEDGTTNSLASGPDESAHLYASDVNNGVWALASNGTLYYIIISTSTTADTASTYSTPVGVRKSGNDIMVQGGAGFAEAFAFTNGTLSSSWSDGTVVRANNEITAVDGGNTGYRSGESIRANKFSDGSSPWQTTWDTTGSKEEGTPYHTGYEILVAAVNVGSTLRVASLDPSTGSHNWFIDEPVSKKSKANDITTDGTNLYIAVNGNPEVIAYSLQ